LKCSNNRFGLDIERIYVCRTKDLVRFRQPFLTHLRSNREKSKEYKLLSFFIEGGYKLGLSCAKLRRS
jgi:hypothetical protein